MTLRDMRAMLVAGCVLLFGCPTPDTEPDLSATSDQASAGELQLETVQPVAYSGTGDPFRMEHLADSRFLQFDPSALPVTREGAGLQSWYTETGPAAIESLSLAAGQESGSKGRVLRIAPSKVDVILSQTLRPLGDLPAKTRVVSRARLKAAKPQELGLTLQYGTAVWAMKAGEAHPGGGDWQEVVLDVPLTQDAKTDSLLFQVVRKASASEPVEIAELSVRLAPPVETEEWVVNGGFDQYAFTDPPYPWIFSYWQGEPGVFRLIPVEGSGKGSYALESTPPKGAGMMLTQRIYGLTDADKGVAFVATADGLAHAEGELTLRVRFMQGGKELPEATQSINHPGDGQWHPMRLDAVVPANTLPDQMLLDIMRRRISDQRTVIDTVSLRRMAANG